MIGSSGGVWIPFPWDLLPGSPQTKREMAACRLGSPVDVIKCYVFFLECDHVCLLDLSLWFKCFVFRDKNRKKLETYT